MENNATFINKDWKEVYRQPVSKYCRVMWYLSAVSTPNVKWWEEVKEWKKVITNRYNIWKRSEFYSRKYFDKDKADNYNFNMDYGSSCGSLEFINWIEQVQNIIMKNKDFVEQYT